MPTDTESFRRIDGADRVALLRHGIVVLEDEVHAGQRYVGCTGAGAEQVLEVVGRRLGDEVDVEVLGDVPRRIRPRRCLGYHEREPGRLQLRYVIAIEEHMDEILVAEDDEAVVVYATFCTPAGGEVGERCDCPWHVYLERPLGRRAVIDGAVGQAVPYRAPFSPDDRPRSARRSGRG